MLRTDAVIFFEFSVIVFDRFVGGFDVGWHCLWMLSESRIITDGADDADFKRFCDKEIALIVICAV